MGIWVRKVEAEGFWLCKSWFLLRLHSSSSFFKLCLPFSFLGDNYLGSISNSSSLPFSLGVVLPFREDESFFREDKSISLGFV